MMKPTMLRKLSALFTAMLLVCLLGALPAAADDLAPYAEEGDLDYIPRYVVTVDPRQDGTADITYEIDWQVIGGDADDYLTWVKIGLANACVDDMTPLTDTIQDIGYSGDGGSYAKVTFTQRYYAPGYAEQKGAESRVHFAFTVHQSHLFTLNLDNTASYDFTPGWFDELCVESMEVRWRMVDGCTADNTGTDGDYLTWEFGPLTHGQAGEVHVTVPVTDTLDTDAAFTGNETYDGVDVDDDDGALFLVIFIFAVAFIVIIAIASQSPSWGGGFGDDIDPDDWFWYTNGVHTVRCLRTAPPPAGYRRTDPPKSFNAGGGHSRGGGVGRHHSSGGGCASSCACACASSCACACACAGGGRAGCSVKDFYTVKLPKTAFTESEE